MEPGFAARVAPLGGALELRWQGVCRQTEQETRRCRGRRDGMSRWESSSVFLSSCAHTHTDLHVYRQSLASRSTRAPFICASVQEGVEFVSGGLTG